MRLLDDTSPVTLILKPDLSSVSIKLNRFMDDFHAQTFAHPMARHLVVWQNRAVFEVKPFGGAIYLDFIQALEIGNGDGRQALQWLLALAKKNDVLIKGSVKRIGELGLTQRDLKTWYRRNGFIVDARANITFDPSVNAALSPVRSKPRKAAL